MRSEPSRPRSIARTLLRLPLAALCVAAAGAAHADVNLLRNGSFETGDFSFWQTRLGDATTFVDFGPSGFASGDATDGRFLAFFGSTAASGGSFISQTFATAPGLRYTLGFDLADDNGGAPPGNAFAVTLDGATLLSVTDLAAQGYVHRTFGFAAQGATTTIGFGGFNDLGYVQLDAVAVTVAAVPEPADWLLLFAGGGVLVLWQRRRAQGRSAAGR